MRKYESKTGNAKVTVKTPKTEKRRNKEKRIVSSKSRRESSASIWTCHYRLGKQLQGSWASGSWFLKSVKFSVFFFCLGLTSNRQLIEIVFFKFKSDSKAFTVATQR
ncbi:uncharacterized protein Dvir_GJ26061, isoform B [Drosophila virilis]|uniref:Uncharacterized protein, isoform B n=1 Tax=Drosophila virilis TaxID=7244 RepID=A0A0Q9WFJ9_DROVI|nr:uncharacterized protein Dvir_GJ26061, isoform B [Drosophila virilis]